MCSVTIMRMSPQEWFGTLCRWPYRHCGPRLPVNSRIYDPPLGPETGKFRDRLGEPWNPGTVRQLAFISAPLY